MMIGMLSGMVAFSTESYMISTYFALFVWVALIVSDEYYLRITDKVEYELSE
jgi:membrane protein DedA with SNARE-associated domain